MKANKKYHKHYSKGLTTKRGGRCKLMSICMMCNGIVEWEGKKEVFECHNC